MPDPHADPAADAPADDDALLFAPEEEAAAPPEEEAWTVLVVDDEPAVHDVTRLALRHIRFEERPLRLLHAHSAGEAREMLAAHDDIAMILLDVVMEEEDSGLELTRIIREQMNNRIVRIVLRTGQPGQAPARQVVTEYDINDYKTKTELTADKLFTTVVQALRSYRDLRTIEASRRSLRGIIESAAGIHNLQSLERFANCVLEQICVLLRLAGGSISESNSGLTAGGETGRFKVFAASGKFREGVGRALAEVIPENRQEALRTVFRTGENVYGETYCIGYARASCGGEFLVYIETAHTLGPLDHEMIDLFCKDVAIGYDNIKRFLELQAAHTRLETGASTRNAKTTRASE